MTLQDVNTGQGKRQGGKAIHTQKVSQPCLKGIDEGKACRELLSRIVISPCYLWVRCASKPSQSNAWTSNTPRTRRKYCRCSANCSVFTCLIVHWPLFSALRFRPCDSGALVAACHHAPPFAPSGSPIAFTSPRGSCAPRSTSSHGAGMPGARQGNSRPIEQAEVAELKFV